MEDIKAKLKEIQYFTEDGMSRSVKGWPEYAGTFIVCIDSYVNNIVMGRICSFYIDAEISFVGLDQLLFAIEGIIDTVGVPQASMERRTFHHRVRGGYSMAQKYGLNLNDKKPFHSPYSMSPTVGKRGTFFVRVYSRQYASMQGVIQNIKSQEPVAFRSCLEFISLIKEEIK